MKRALILLLFIALIATGAIAQPTAIDTDPNAPGGTGGGGNLASQPQLVDHGGAKMPYAKVVYIFWGTFPPGYASELQAFRKEEGGMVSHMGMLAQYKAWQTSLIGPQADVFDTTEPPIFSGDFEVRGEVAKWFADRYDTNAIYVVILSSGHVAMTRKGSESCGGQTVKMCAYHESYKDPASGIDVKYAVIPYAFCSACQVHAPDGTAANDVQNAEVFVIHEVREAMTDPIYLTAWYDSNNDEGDDKCASEIFYKHTIPGPNDTPYYHPSRFFFFQKEWSNEYRGCVP
jgi:hypothetical protein